jgi:hypothetical protein
MIRPVVLLVLLVAVMLAACGPVTAPPPRGSQPPRARCLSDPNESGTRPLIFLFCIENP